MDLKWIQGKRNASVEDTENLHHIGREEPSLTRLLTMKMTSTISKTVAYVGSSNDSESADTSTSFGSTRYYGVPVFSHAQSDAETQAMETVVTAMLTTIGGNVVPTVMTTLIMSEIAKSGQVSGDGVQTGSEISETVILSESPTTTTTSIESVPPGSDSPKQTTASTRTPRVSIPAETSAVAVQPPESNAPSSTGTTTIATVVPVVLVAVAVLVFLWWWRCKSKNKKARDDLEREAVWVNGNKSTNGSSDIKVAKRRKHATSNTSTVISQATVNTNVAEAADAPLIPSKSPKAESPCVPPLPKVIRRAEANNFNMQQNHPDVSQLEDPFLTPPTHNTLPPNLNSISLGASQQFRSSQIGLAVTTPPPQLMNSPSPSPAHPNTSSVSVADSIQTVLHHAPQETSNPFRNATTGDGAGDSSSGSNDSRPTTSNSVQQSLIPAPLSRRNTSKAGPQIDGTNEQSLTKSSTPPEELARRWIEVLKMEAAQAQVAADEAKLKAEELKKRDAEA